MCSACLNATPVEPASATFQEWIAAIRDRHVHTREGASRQASGAGNVFTEELDSIRN